ncbi:MAG: chemotaxis protein CheC [Methanolobus sp.]|jgi:chemotaxis protein CheC|uniref:Chemotaxis protein CheC, inhibitor of MCP methylation n=1 Tax=Methanolobus tindarius DSM 2278 TaxID=1090322 RepID=W9DPW2_METTI|nr:MULTISPECIES: chemotaxis protein CheC [Methanolobus]ETA67230.1 chemotaxis protein CheC, inhibitor of MCP methylation [Methanolobus tindarius DSM 2278]MDK2832372.1 chemotaxis protein CheC [Methanolobus sp.]MDK2939198.1 chemotaxis protein CheC [Methanolobus sp.]
MAEMDEMARGAFQEAGNIGMGHLATSLSKMVNRDVKIDIPVVEMLTLDEIIEKSNEEGKNKSVVGIHLHITGDVSGGTLILLPKFSALSFSDLLMKKSIGTTNKIEEQQVKKLREMGVNLCSAYMRVVNEFLGIHLNIGDPSMEVNMEGVGDFIKQEIGQVADQFIVVKGECLIPSTNSRNEFNMLFEPGATDIIMAAIMKKMMG